ncbi:hypothetical protein RhiirA5_443067 [Rhizophagus irregularis]|uniref:ATP-dependent DNA helicase n=1 Tax=Rhizophagus irregularis TaxID=588596 RepID=A0A2N0NEC0_9GLOM|nr:hypothetical protein RhiirA5_443067 [Rhizophagus irregularis]
MPILPTTFNNESNRLIREKQEYNIEELLKLAKDDFSNRPKGTGKTFLYSNLLAKICLEKHIALAIASSGIARSRLLIR